MPTVGDRVLDNGLSALKAEATDININTAEPATWTAATAGAAFLGKRSYGSGNVFPAAIAAGSPNGRKVTTVQVTDGAVSTTGTAAACSVTDGSAATPGNQRLLATNTLSSSQTVTSGNPWTLNAFDIRLPGA
jgi:hypothetical protein